MNNLTRVRVDRDGAWLTPHAEAQALVDSLTAERDAALEDAKRLREALTTLVVCGGIGPESMFIAARAALKGQP